MRRSRWATAAAIGGLAAALLTGCGNPGGVDGAIADDWVRLSEPKQFVPEAQTCHEAGYAAFASLAAYKPVDCAGPHRAETVHVGTFTGAGADRTSPPPQASPELRAAYAECDKRVTTFAGGDFRTARLWLGVVVPSASAWSGGARWFRCDLFELANVEDFAAPVSREGSLKGAVAAGSALALGCYQVRAAADGSIDAMTPIACTKTHNSEFVGVHTAPAATAYPKKDADWQRMHAGCRKVVAGYVKVPDDAELQFRTGTVAVPNLESDWEVGNRGVRCYLYLKDAKFTRSLKGAGSKALPAR